MPGDTYRYCPRCAASLIEKQIYNMPRQVCPHCGLIYFLEPKLVTVVVVQHEGKLLLGRRNIDPGKGAWSFFGGYVERGEKVEVAALREVKEETNLEVQLEHLIGIYSENGLPHVVIAYQASIVCNDTSKMAAQPDEVSELAFFPLAELPALAFPTDEHIVDYLKNQA